MQVHHIECPWGSDCLTRGRRGQANVVYIVWAVCTRWGGQHGQEPGCWALCHFNWWGKDDSHVETVQFLLLLGRGCPGLTPYRKVLTMQVLHTATFTGMVSLGFSQGRVVSHPRVVAVLPMSLLISGSKDSCITKVRSCRWWRQMICPQLVPAHWSSSGEWLDWSLLRPLGESVHHTLHSLLKCELTAAPLAKSMSPMTVSHTLVFALSLAMF